MKRRGFLATIAAALCLPFVAKKAMAAPPAKTVAVACHGTWLVASDGTWRTVQLQDYEYRAGDFVYWDADRRCIVPGPAKWREHVTVNPESRRQLEWH